jgi:hypothetical protein
LTLKTSAKIGVKGKFHEKIAIGMNTNISRKATIKTIGGGTIKIWNHCTIHDLAMLFFTYLGFFMKGDQIAVNPICVK